MEVNKITLGAFGLLVLALVIGVFVHNRTVSNLESQLNNAKNLAATKDQTIEVQKGVYTKLAQDHDKLKDLLNNSSAENERLQKQITDDKEKITQATDLAVYWKGQFKQAVIGTSTPVEDDPHDHTNVILLPSSLMDLHSGKVDFGLVSATCDVRTSNPPKFNLTIDKGSKSLGLRVLMSQDKVGMWHSYVTSDDEKIGVNILTTAIDTSQFTPKWYEKISLRGELGIGDGLLGGVGANYRFGNFDVGPAAWFTLYESKAQKYYGASFTWYPFARN